MKKILLFLVAGMLAIATCGCSGGNGGQTSDIEAPDRQSDADSDTDTDADSDSDSDFDTVCNSGTPVLDNQPPPAEDYTEEVSGVSFDMIYIPGGTFTLGC